MLKQGHLGLGLAVYVPFGALLLFIGSLELFLLGLGCCAFGALVPDIDTDTPIFKHRGWTHTVWFVALLSITGAVGIFMFTAYLVTPKMAAIGIAIELTWVGATFGGLMLAVGMLSHLLGDMITPRGIRPFDPLTPRGILPISVSDRKYAFDLTKASNTTANAGFLLLGFGGIAGILFAIPPTF